ncbi:MAG TPA: c-type cytochrome, partial [Anaerolineae bacterium]|nr:c-type cytochrome [Anaerolineae bacterium]
IMTPGREKIQEGAALFAKNCASCHGQYGEGGPNPVNPNDLIAPISSADFLETRDDATIRAIIAKGQPNLGMVPFSTDEGGPLDDDQIDALVAFIRSWETNPPVIPPTPTPTPTPVPSPTPTGEAAAAGPTPTEAPKEISFSADVMPILQSRCSMCHGALGGWSAESYDKVVNSGDHGPVIVPGKPDESLLVEKLLGKQKIGDPMPPSGLPMTQEEKDVIIEWVKAGAPDN